MPVTYSIDKTRRVIRTLCTGNVTLNEILDHFATLVKDVDRPSRLHVLLDLTQTTSLPESDQIRAVSQEIDRIQSTLRFDSCAIVAASDALYGMARMFEVFAAKNFSSTRVFRELTDAEAWLESQLSGRK